MKFMQVVSKSLSTNFIMLLALKDNNSKQPKLKRRKRKTNENELKNLDKKRNKIRITHAKTYPLIHFQLPRIITKKPTDKRS